MVQTIFEICISCVSKLSTSAGCACKAELRIVFDITAELSWTVCDGSLHFVVISSRLFERYVRFSLWEVKSFPVACHYDNCHHNHRAVRYQPQFVPTKFYVCCSVLHFVLLQFGLTVCCADTLTVQSWVELLVVMSMCFCWCLYVCLFVCLSLYVCVCMYVCIYMYLCMCVYMYLYICMYFFYLLFMHAPLPLGNTTCYYIH